MYSTLDLCKAVTVKKNSLTDIKNNNNIDQILDTVDSQLEEVFLIRNPEFRYKTYYQDELVKFKEELLGGNQIVDFGDWFIFPKDRLCIHYLPDEIHQELRTARNRNIITLDEQKYFYNFSVGIAGLSIGSHAASTITMMGGAKNLKLADPDTLSGSNLNRVRYDFSKVGANKTLLAAESILKVNPYSKLQIYSDGINDNNILDFFTKPERIDILVEEVDNIRLKFELRFLAKEYKIPVIMATDNGDNVILDIERYDIDEDLKIFNGLVGDINKENLDDIPNEVLKSLVGNIVGVDIATDKVLESLVEVGKSIYSWPQLGNAANMSGSIIAYIIRSIATKQPIRSGKYSINIESIFNSSKN